jgi:hypothetical protein
MEFIEDPSSKGELFATLRVVFRADESIVT